MNLTESHTITFAAPGCSTPAGQYILDDCFKPYLTELRSPAGHLVSAAMPNDHKHHKGLMYALCCPDIKWWEEDPGDTFAAGQQKILSTVLGKNGELTQQLLWCALDGSLETFREERSISCAHLNNKYLWRWRSEFEVLRDCFLKQSEWSMPSNKEGGRKINYHGLGLRFSRDFAHPTPKRQAFVDGHPSSVEDAHGSKPRSVSLESPIDGHYVPPIVRVTMEQIDTRHAAFLLAGDFAYLSMGPSNWENIDLAAGSNFTESFTVTIEDLPE